VKLYVYALVPPETTGALGGGIEDEPLRLVVLGPVAAVVGAIVRASDAVLPLRFGAMVTGEEELRDGFRPRLEALAAALERTRGRDQMTVRIYADEKPPRTGGKAPESGARWLRERAAHPLVERLRASLAPLVHAERIEAGLQPPLRASVFHLVDRARVAEYEARVRALSAGARSARIAASGPWPPYAFTELE
jgi:hypothetical protein